LLENQYENTTNTEERKSALARGCPVIRLLRVGVEKLAAMKGS